MKRLVLVGNGMAGMACVEQILKYDPMFRITVFGDETHANYNRINLTDGCVERPADSRQHSVATYPVRVEDGMIEVALPCHVAEGQVA